MKLWTLDIGLWTRIKFWFTTRRECVWCQQRHWIGGNPFAREVTGGMCPDAQTKFDADTQIFNSTHNPLSRVARSEAGSTT